MMEAAHQRNRQDPSPIGRLHRPRLGAVILQRQVRDSDDNIPGIPLYVGVGCGLEYDHVVEALPVNGASHALHGVLSVSLR